MKEVYIKRLENILLNKCLFFKCFPYICFLKYLYKKVIMEKVINFIKKYKIYILGFLLLFFLARSCSKSGDIKKVNRQNVEYSNQVDSLIKLNSSLQQKIDSFPEILRKQKLNIHMDYDNYISKQDRGKQLMDLHMIVKENIRELQVK